MKNLKFKSLLFALALTLSAMLSGCQGDYTISDAVVVDKPIPPGYRSSGVVTIEKDGSRYSYRVSDSSYRVAEVGARVDVEYRSAGSTARIKPVADVMDSKGETE